MIQTPFTAESILESIGSDLGELSLGVEVMDDQHLYLIELMAQAQTALREGRIGDQIQEILHGLAAFTIVHFQAEERLMREHQYPDQFKHVQSHERFRAQIKELRSHDIGQRPDDALQIVAMMQHWIIEHILVEDREFANYLHGRDPSPSQPT